MSRYSRRRERRLIILAATNPAEFEKVRGQRVKSKLHHIHQVAGDLTLPIGAFDVADHEVNLLRRCITDKQVIRDVSSTLESEAVRALRMKGC